MSAGYLHRLHHSSDSPVHRLPAHVKLVAALGFVLAVVSTPREQVWAFAAYAVLLGGVAVVARVPAGFVLRRMVVEVPFVAFAVLLPFIATGERVDVLGVGLSVSGLWGAWNILAKGTLGVATSVLLAATTAPRDMLLGLDRLRVPPMLVQIMGFMVRYADVITAEMRRMRIARESRGFLARDIRHARVVARSAGALFIRSYERGERVHLAMLSRGYAGRMPDLGSAAATHRQWTLAAVVPGAAAAIALASWAVQS